MAIASDRGCGAGVCEAAVGTVAVEIVDGAESDGGSVRGVDGGVGSALGEALEAALVFALVALAVALGVAFGDAFGSVEGENSWGSGL